MSWRTSMAVSALALLAATALRAQSPLALEDLNGTWTISSSAGGNPDQTESTRLPQADPPLRPAYQAIWQARQQRAAAATARGAPLATTTIACLPQGMPSMMGSGGPFPMEILVSRDQVTIIQEAYNQVRRVYLNQPQSPLEDLEPGFFGRSVGTWDGSALVIDTLGIKESVEFRNVPHSAGMRITERLRLIDADTLVDEITIEDPAVLTEPWRLTFEYSRLSDYEMMEYICEDNREYVDDTGAIRLRID